MACVLVLLSHNSPTRSTNASIRVPIRAAHVALWPCRPIVRIDSSKTTLHRTALDHACVHLEKLCSCRTTSPPAQHQALSIRNTPRNAASNRTM
eukprot:6196748-Amphidinium_carterae.1